MNSEDFSSFNLKNIKTIHFTGIGGISMSGIAEIMLSLGYTVTGSDLRSTAITAKLTEKGVKISAGHSSDNISNQDLLVYTPAVKQDNPELVKARELGIPVVDRATLLGRIMEKYTYGIAVSGTHGKTTCSSMISLIMIKAGMDPTVQIGGELDFIGGTARIGGNRYFVAEACEYCGSFLKFHPHTAVILNIEFDHSDYYKDSGHVEYTFAEFARLVPESGNVVLCADDPACMRIAAGLGRNIQPFGLNNESNPLWTAEEIAYNRHGCASFNLVRNGRVLERITLAVPGRHNIYNALAAAAAVSAYGCPSEAIRKALEDFRGTRRRFEAKGSYNGIDVFDDYAHHPSEIRATLSAAKRMGYTRIWCIFQPHTYSRTISLLDDFARSFADADNIVLADIYAAREIDTGEISSGILAEKVRNAGKNAIYLPGFEEITEYIYKNAASGDMVITMGAGDIDSVAGMLLKR